MLQRTIKRVINDYMGVSGSYIYPELFESICEKYPELFESSMWFLLACSSILISLIVPFG